MKKKILFLALFLVAVVASFQFSTKHPKLDGLMLENIEALATNEGNSGSSCYGTGSVDCPNINVKVYLIYKGDFYALR